jgi:quinoprotein glucose dehydrogenase
MIIAIATLLWNAAQADSNNWPNVGNDKGGMRYSTLKQINRKSVKNLQVAWTYHTGDAAAGNGSTIECTPIIVDGVMYVTTAKVKVVALNAATGEPIWEFDPKGTNVNRGVAYWADEKPGGARRILIASNGKLTSLDAKSGKPDLGFGTEGVVDLRKGMGPEIARQNYGSTSAPAIYHDLAIIPIHSSESQPGAPGDVRAFNVRTGKEVWRFHTAPHPGEYGNKTWAGDSWRDRSGANAWSGYTIDTKNGIVYCGLGSAASDFYGADRVGANLFANCTLALDARTGKRIWHFQTVHHDLWDHDLPCPPVVCSITRNGKKVEAVAQPTKTGFVYVFDRLTGKPLYDVKEVPAQTSSVTGEQAWLTQPEPVNPPILEPKLVTGKDFSNLSPESHEYVMNMVKKYRFGREYEAPSTEGTIISPGFHGGANWSGACVDPSTNILYINTNNVPCVCKLNKNSKDGYDFDGYTFLTDKDGYPAVKPPWGHLTAVDLNKGEFVWRNIFGEYPKLKAMGMPPTGTQNFGGSIVTAGGLVFIGGTMDEMFHAYDKSNGKLLWEFQLPAGGYATPATYMVNGKQFVVIAAGGGGKLGTKSGDTFVAFALKE